jgi:hypothetical protein
MLLADGSTTVVHFPSVPFSQLFQPVCTPSHIVTPWHFCPVIVAGRRTGEKLHKAIRGRRQHITVDAVVTRQAVFQNQTPNSRRRRHSVADSR